MSGWDTFDREAAAYHAVRPSYPPLIFERIREYAPELPAAPEVVEIGVGTGQATKQMAAAGWHILGVEPGPDLANAARRDLAAFENVRVETARFEDIELPLDRYDLVTAATSWHWVDPDVGIPKAAGLLRPGGALALWWNAHVTDTPDPRWAPIRRVYEDVAPHLARLAPLTPDRPDYDPAAELQLSGHFTDIEQHRFPFSVTYSVAAFLALIGTYASHRTLSDDIRDRLHRELAEAIDRELAGVVTKPYECLLVLGRPRVAGA